MTVDGTTEFYLTDRPVQSLSKTVDLIADDVLEPGMTYTILHRRPMSATARIDTQGAAIDQSEHVISHTIVMPFERSGR
jgi:hypothetical protein